MPYHVTDTRSPWDTAGVIERIGSKVDIYDFSSYAPDPLFTMDISVAGAAGDNVILLVAWEDYEGSAASLTGGATILDTDRNTSVVPESNTNPFWGHPGPAPFVAYSVALLSHTLTGSGVVPLSFSAPGYTFASCAYANVGVTSISSPALSVIPYQSTGSTVEVSSGTITDEGDVAIALVVGHTTLAGSYVPGFGTPVLPQGVQCLDSEALSTHASLTAEVSAFIRHDTAATWSDPAGAVPEPGEDLPAIIGSNAHWDAAVGTFRFHRNPVDIVIEPAGLLASFDAP